MRAKEASAGYSSPLVYAGKVYTLNGSGFVSCADAKTGKLHYKERTKGAYSASPVAGDGKVYCLNETGATTVVKADTTEFEVLATNDLGEEETHTLIVRRSRQAARKRAGQGFQIDMGDAVVHHPAQPFAQLRLEVPQQRHQGVGDEVVALDPGDQQIARQPFRRQRCRCSSAQGCRSPAAAPRAPTIHRRPGSRRSGRV